MKFIPTEFPQKKCRYGRKQAEVMEFMSMNESCVRVENPDTETKTWAACFNQAAGKLNMPCRARFVNKELYVVRTDK